MVPPAKVDEVAAKLKDADGLLIVHLSHHGGDAPVLSKLIDVGLPTALFSQPFCGHGWMYFPQWHKQGKKVVLLPSSDWSELDRAVGLLRVPARMKHTRVLCVGGPHGTAGGCSASHVKEKLGVELVTITNDTVMDAYEGRRSQGRREGGAGVLDQQGPADRRAHRRRRSSTPRGSTWRSRT